ncbi:hypothetical protein [Nocardioides sp.]|uniref:hypothetical protein n=1 Tax=Nocardioides sp. TaxID=35761 RepID=UPI002B6A6E7C|nr:hypothetical protein [Nocardioides sp.]HXH81054.1 hypothetical protein [Nocardioides sp.]
MLDDEQDFGQGVGHDIDPFEVFTGDPPAAARLRANLTRIAEDHPGTGVASIANEVLEGRRSIRDLADDPDFSEVIAEGVSDYRRYLDSLTPAERAEMVESASEAPN